MEIHLAGKVAEIVKSEVVTDGYSNAAAFISDIVLNVDEYDQHKLNRLRHEVNVGLDEIKCGEIVEFDLDDIFSKDVK